MQTPFIYHCNLSFFKRYHERSNEIPVNSIHCILRKKNVQFSQTTSEKGPTINKALGAQGGRSLIAYDVHFHLSDRFERGSITATS